MLFILKVSVANKNYYVTDLSGSLSRSIQDSMICFKELAAEAYAGPIEHLIEVRTNGCATVSVLGISPAVVIPRTALECVPCP